MAKRMSQRNLRLPGSSTGKCSVRICATVLRLSPLGREPARFLRGVEMSLSDLHYLEDYRSGYNDLIREFFQPSLREAQAYSRAVGYFSSSALEAFGVPLADFVKRDGRIRLVTSVELSASDLEAIRSGTHRQDVCEHRLERIIDEEFAEGVGDGTARLGRLIELNRLEIRIAVPKEGTGIYHEKIGIFVGDGVYVAFTGSSNESRNAFENNRECIDVFPSWSSPSRAERKRKHFEDLWNCRDRGVDVYTFPEAARKKLLRMCGVKRSFHSIPPAVGDKWHHQDDAVREFLRAKRGVLDMATGTGKTRIASTIIRILFANAEIDTGIVCVDGNDLLDQWYGELLSIRKRIEQRPPILREYKNHRQISSFCFAPENSILLSRRESVDKALKQLSDSQRQRTLLVYDEVHGLGSPGNRKRLRGLSDNIRFRLGLSATPERTYDEEGTKFIEEHIGPVLMRFELGDAIKRGILAPFKYYPLDYEPSERDRERLKAVFTSHNVRRSSGEPVTDKDLYTRIAAVYKTSDAKIPVFEEFIKNHRELLRRCIVFTHEQDYGIRVSEIIHKFHPGFHTYYTGEDSETLKRFARGELECLVTCHRLSEGVDIRSLSTVILFSSDKARLETIQRIGRCLRTDPNVPNKVASIVDFVRRSSDRDSPTSDEERRDWLAKLANVRPGH